MNRTASPNSDIAAYTSSRYRLVATMGVLRRKDVKKAAFASASQKPSNLPELGQARLTTLLLTLPVQWNDRLDVGQSASFETIPRRHDRISKPEAMTRKCPLTFGRRDIRWE
jgi:hypothetical protein